VRPRLADAAEDALFADHDRARGEWRRIFAGLDGVAVYQSRIPSPIRIAPDTYSSVWSVASTMSPIGARGGAAVERELHAGAVDQERAGGGETFGRVHRGAQCTTPITAAVAGLKVQA